MLKSRWLVSMTSFNESRLRTFNPPARRIPFVSEDHFQGHNFLSRATLPHLGDTANFAASMARIHRYSG